MKCQVKSCPETTAKPKDDGWANLHGVGQPPGGAWYCSVHADELDQLLGGAVSIAKVDADGNDIPGTRRFVMAPGRA
jgi:hypothetical protein